MRKTKIFPENNEYTAEHVKLVQELLYEALKTVTDILEENEIDYALAFGTLLGAIRHKGFIPWDDDIDIFIRDENYNDAITTLRKNLPNHLLVHDRMSDPRYFHCWARIKDLRTSVRSSGVYHKDNDSLNYQCVGLDLYNLQKTDKKRLPIATKKEYERFLNHKLKSGLINETEFKKSMEGLPEYVHKKCVPVIKNSTVEEGRFFIFGFDRIIPEEFFFPTKKVQFCDQYFRAPSEPEKILEIFYDNYTQSPPFNERKTGLSFFSMREHNNTDPE